MDTMIPLSSSQSRIAATAVRLCAAVALALLPQTLYAQRGRTGGRGGGYGGTAGYGGRVGGMSGYRGGYGGTAANGGRVGGTAAYGGRVGGTGHSAGYGGHPAYQGQRSSQQHLGATPFQPNRGAGPVGRNAGPASNHYTMRPALPGGNVNHLPRSGSNSLPANRVPGSLPTNRPQGNQLAGSGQLTKNTALSNHLAMVNHAQAQTHLSGTNALPGTSHARGPSNSALANSLGAGGTGGGASGPKGDGQSLTPRETGKAILQGYNDAKSMLKGKPITRKEYTKLEKEAQKSSWDVLKFGQTVGELWRNASNALAGDGAPTPPPQPTPEPAKELPQYVPPSEPPLPPPTPQPTPTTPPPPEPYPSGLGGQAQALWDSLFGGSSPTTTSPQPNPGPSQLKKD